MIVCRDLGVISLVNPYQVNVLVNYAVIVAGKKNEKGLLGPKVIIREAYGIYLGTSRPYIISTDF